MDGSVALKEKIKNLRVKLGVPPQAPLPMGFGLLGWILDRPTDDDRIVAILEERPTAIWLSFGPDLGKYVKKVC